MVKSMRFIEDDKDVQSDDLPWAKEYFFTTGAEEDIERIIRLIPGSKGILAITRVYKGFIFKGTQTYNHLVVAIPVWKQDPRLNFSLFSKLLPSGKIQIGIEEGESCIAVFSSNGHVEFKLPNLGDGLGLRDSPNPFLPNTPVPTTSTTTRRGKRTSDEVETHY
jgi:hypothetical protein